MNLKNTNAIPDNKTLTHQGHSTSRLSIDSSLPATRPLNLITDTACRQSSISYSAIRQSSFRNLKCALAASSLFSSTPRLSFSPSDFRKANFSLGDICFHYICFLNNLTTSLSFLDGGMDVVNQRIKIIRHIGFKSHLLAAGGVHEGNRFGMKR